MNAPFPHPDLALRLWDDLRLSEYLGAINERHNVVDYIAMPNLRDAQRLRLDWMFVNPLLADKPGSTVADPATWPAGITLFQALTEFQRLVVLGDPGCGKTTLANWLAWRLTVSFTERLPAVLEERLPLVCTLREMKAGMFAQSVGIPELLDWNVRHYLGEEAVPRHVAVLHQWVAAKRYVLILDGIDEISMVQRKAVARWMRQAVADEAVVLATGRIVGYEDYPVDCLPRLELANISMAGLAMSGDDGSDDGACDGTDGALVDASGAVSEDILGDDSVRGAHATRTRFAAEQAASNQESAWAQRMYLLPFDDQRIAAFIRNWYEQRGAPGQTAAAATTDLLRAIKASKDILALARTPNLLSLMAIVHRERANLPNGRALLYKEIANAYLNTIDTQRKLSPGDVLARYPVEIREGWIAYIGFQMQALRAAQTDNGNLPHDQDNIGILVEKASVLTWLADAMTMSNMPQATQHAEEFLAWVARRSGLLLPRGEDWYAFAHLSFQEYFAARFLVAQVTSPAFIRGGKAKGLLVDKEVLGKYGDAAVWRETLIYLLELVCNERGVDWLQEVLLGVFGDLGAENDFSMRMASLAGKVLNDQHIYLSEQDSRQLANKSANDCIFVLPIGTFADLCRAGYALDMDAPNGAGLDQLTLEQRANIFAIRAEATTTADVSSIGALAQLKALHLQGEEISDLGPLSNLQQLRYLDTLGTPVSELADIGKMKELRTLRLRLVGNPVLAPLAQLTHLWNLMIWGATKPDIASLAQLKNLKVLDLEDATDLVDYEPLAELVGLQVFYPGNKVSLRQKESLQALKKKLPNLHIFRID